MVSDDDGSTGLDEHARAFLAAIVESSDDAIVGMDLQGIVRSWNRGAEKLFGYSAEEMIGRSITTLIPEERLGEEGTILARLRAGQRIEHFETVRVAKDGHRVPVSLTVSPIRHDDGRIVGASKIARDIGARLRAEEAVHRSQRMLRAVVEAAPVAISVIDRDGVVHLWNSAAERIFGWPRDEVVGQVARPVPPDRREEFVDHLRRTFAGEPLQGVETTRQCKDGEPVEVSLWSSIIEPHESEPDRLISIAADIGDRKRAEAALRDRDERLRMALAASRTGTFRWNLQTDRVEIDDGLHALLGMRPVTRTYDLADCLAWLHPEDRSMADAALERLLADGRELRIDHRVVLPDGRTRWLATSARTICHDSGAPLYVTGASVDVTERKMAEASLREANRRKDHFLATLAHELRNPLAPILTGIELLRLADDPDTVGQVRDTVERQTRYMARLVDDLLDVSRITRDRVELRFEEVDVLDVVRGAVETSQPLIAERGHQLEIHPPDEPIGMNADPARVAQVLANLLNNAAKYTPDGGRIDLAVRRAGEHVEIAVSDTGQGLTEADLDRVFDMFVQVEQGESSASGLGIGLTLVKSLTELHGGTVHASSAGPGEGSTFTVRLPALPAHAMTGSRSSAPPPAGSEAALRILLADDNHDAADSLRVILERRGHEVHVAYDGPAALAAARRFRPDAALLDLGMPGLDGFAVARELRVEPWANDLTLIALTGWGQEGARERSHAAGFDHHLVKPTDLRHLDRCLPKRPRAAS